MRATVCVSNILSWRNSSSQKKKQACCRFQCAQRFCLEETRKGHFVLFVPLIYELTKSRTPGERGNHVSVTQDSFIYRIPKYVQYLLLSMIETTYQIQHLTSAFNANEIITHDHQPFTINQAKNHFFFQE